MEPNVIYQYSLLSALMAGVANTGISASTLATKGTDGLGTFVSINGELVMLDGRIYQFTSDGSAVEADPKALIPYAVAVPFEAQKRREGQTVVSDNNVNVGGGCCSGGQSTAAAAPAPTKAPNLTTTTTTTATTLDQLLDDLVPGTANLFVAYRLSGRFSIVTTRCCRPQAYDGEPLANLAAEQIVTEHRGAAANPDEPTQLQPLTGTLIGFRSPKAWQGFTVAGYHTHFISTDRTRGGHVLNFLAEDVSVEVAVATDVRIQMPVSPEFNGSALGVDHEAIVRAEG